MDGQWINQKNLFLGGDLIKGGNRVKNVVIGFGITEKTIACLKKADGLVIGSALCKKISESLKKRQNPVTNVVRMVSRLKSKIS